MKNAIFFPGKGQSVKIAEGQGVVEEQQVGTSLIHGTKGICTYIYHKKSAIPIVSMYGILTDLHLTSWFLW